VRRSKDAERSAPVVSLAGQVVIVTGGGRGLGRAHVLELGRRGARVVVNARRAESAREVAEQVLLAGGDATACEVAVGSAADASALVDAAIARYGTVDAVIHNAGSMRNAYFEDQTERTLGSLIDLHLVGPFFITQAAWPVMRAKRHGRIVFTGSSAMFGMGGASNYAATKAAVVGLSRALAFEGREHGILVNTVLPQATTDLRRGDPDIKIDVRRAAATAATSAEHQRWLPPGLRDAIAGSKSPDVVAPLIAYLASRSCAVTGETFAAGCGRFARVFVGETTGWCADGPVTAEGIAANVERICAMDDYFVPATLYDEIEAMAVAIGAWPIDR
jgi:NAD(P)-dependent dehydrogenase (short-subunit alcohol dehydrogenase family)